MTPVAPTRVVARLGGLHRVRVFASAMGNVLLAWLVLLMLEHVVVGLGQRAEFSASWEIGLARKFLTPIALAALLPCSFFAVLVGTLASLGGHDRRARACVAMLLAGAALAFAYGVSFGRHMASWSLRAPFLGLFAVLGFAFGWVLVPRLARWDGRALAVLGGAGAIVFWVADLSLLPRLYPAFHAALFVLMLASGALLTRLSRAERGEPASRGAWAGIGMLGLAGLCLAFAPAAATRLRGADNLRMVLLDHAPILGRAVRIASLLAPPLPLDEPSTGATSVTAGEIPRALDWAGHDVLLLSVDALRADHVSAYGYPRRTTPNLDALARDGALFDSAYCPTPHTSYSITSMMTGKAMRPLLSLGLGQDSETWAAALRRYGYRTAAFYPPAVFFIDEDRFKTFETRGFDFEYRKVEFTPAARRVEQVRAYLHDVPKMPLFLWVHLFEPHEPYEMHADHPFGPPEATRAVPVDAYDSEIAEADDAIGEIAREFRRERPGAIVLVTADHGEEFGEHGGHYHGTSCYEEQVHVPLVVVGPGVVHRRVHTVVQTLDLYPTVLSALGIPRPARLRGRDLGPLLAKSDANGEDDGFAYAETDEYTLLARGDDRLVCARRVGACALYDVAHDPEERHDRSSATPKVVTDLRRMTAAALRDQEQYEGEAGGEWPEALRRGMQGEVLAADEVATLLDDVNVKNRRKAAEVLFRLRPPGTAPQLRRSLARDEDNDVKRWSALALVRVGDVPPPLANELLGDGLRDWRRVAALAFAERGDARGAGELAQWWSDEAPPREGLDVEAGKELLAAMSRIHDTGAVPALLTSFAFVPLRPWIADALGSIGDARARGPMLAAFREERYVTAREHEARALLTLGARAELLPPLARFAGVPEPMVEAIILARQAHLLEPARGGIAMDDAASETVATTLVVPVGVPLRLLALVRGDGQTLTGTVAGRALPADHGDQRVGLVHVFELEPTGVKDIPIELHETSGLLAAWVVRRADEVPPPPPEDAGVQAGRPEHHN